MLDGTYTAKYIGKPIQGYIPNQKYEIIIEKTFYSYSIESTTENTGTLLYASEISINNNWIFD